MISTYSKMAFRSIRKYPMFSSLNIFGLSVGLAIAGLLLLHVRNELSFDRYHSKADRIHRVMLNAFWDPEKPMTLATTPNVVAVAAKEVIPAVEQSARVYFHEFGKTAFIQAGNNKFVEEHFYWADPGLVDIFDIPVVAGDLRAALDQPNCVALSRAVAIRFFGTSAPIGQFIKVDRMDPLEVKAVYEDFPDHSSLNANIIGSFKSVRWANQKLVWSNSSFETWFLLSPDAEPNRVVGQLAELLDKNVPKADQRFSFWLQALPHVHLGSSKIDFSANDTYGDPRQVTILGVLALAILLIACFNYMNLSTARFQLRAREVGVNKAMGAQREQLMVRFFTETGVIGLVSVGFALLLMLVGIPLFNRLSDGALRWQQLFQPSTILVVSGIFAVVVLVAGFYPALFLSSFSPKNLLVGHSKSGTTAGWMRKGLVTLQFTASVALIIATLVLWGQMKYIQQKNLGFSPHQVVAVTVAGVESRAQAESFQQACRSISAIEESALAQTYPGGGAWSMRSLRKNENDQNGLNLSTCRTAPNFEKVLGIKLLAGTTLPTKLPTDTISYVVLNRTAVAYLGMTPEEVIGKQVECDLDNNRVVGVIEDFHAASLHKEVAGYAFHDAPTEGRRCLLVKMNTSDVPGTMQQIQAAFGNTIPHSAFEYKFLDDQIDHLYRREARTAKTMVVFSVLSILISCLGLFGLAAFAAEQRVKEIGVRKVLGASVASITGLLAKDFMILVLVAIVLAVPVAYYFAGRWLSDFAYHIEPQWWMFAVAGLLGVAIAFATVGIQGVRAALANPIKSLRNE
jgi:putative ABC transport system permease protein